MRTTVSRDPANGSSPEGITATTEYTDASGVRQWTRRYPVPGTSARACAVAISGAAANIADEFTIIDDAPAEPRPPPPPLSPEPAPPAEPVAAAPPSPPSTRSGRPPLELGAGGFVSIGTAPRVTGTVTLHLGVVVASFERARLSVAAEGSFGLPASDARGVQTQLFAFSPVVCGQKDLPSGGGVTWGLLGCLLGTVGSFRGTWHDSERAASRSATYGAAGGRVGVTGGTSAIALRVQGDVLYALPAHVLGPAGESAATGSVATNAGVAVVVPF